MSKALNTKTKKHLEALAPARLINYSIITSEYQTALKVAPILCKVLPEGFADIILKRLNQLEDAARKELLFIFNVDTKAGQLAQTPIYTENEANQLSHLYRVCLRTPSDEEIVSPLQSIVNSRKNSPILFAMNAPIFSVSEFLDHAEYKAILANESYSDERLDLIHQTLFYVFNAASEGLSSLLGNSHLLDKDTLETLELHTVRC